MKSFSSIFLALAVTALAQDYHRDIAPILRTYCAGCHNDTDLEGEFSMETFAALRKGGEKGDPLKVDEKGPLFLRAIEGTVKAKMPPKDEPQLPAAEMATLKKWLAAGAPGPAKDVSLFKSLSVPKLAGSAKSAQPVSAAAYSLDGKMLAVAQGGVVEIRTAADNAVLQRLDGFPGKVNSVHFSPDGARLLVATGIVGLSGTALFIAAFLYANVAEKLDKLWFNAANLVGAALLLTPISGGMEQARGDAELPATRLPADVEAVEEQVPRDGP